MDGVLDASLDPSTVANYVVESARMTVAIWAQSTQVSV